MEEKAEEMCGLAITKPIKLLQNPTPKIHNFSCFGLTKKAGWWSKRICGGVKGMTLETKYWFCITGYLLQENFLWRQQVFK